jgi:nucleoside-diphosphate-sugar epimerase
VNWLSRNWYTALLLCQSEIRELVERPRPLSCPSLVLASAEPKAGQRFHLTATGEFPLRLLEVTIPTATSRMRHSHNRFAPPQAKNHHTIAYPDTESALYHLRRPENMPKTRILLTGANSFTGLHILVRLLSHHTAVRAVVNSQEAAPALQNRYELTSSSSLDFVTVSERESLVPGIFENALRHTSEPFHAVVHTLNTNSFDEADCLAKFIKLETDAIIGFLRSIHEVSPAVSRVVIVGSLIPFARWLGDPHSFRTSERAVNGYSSSSVVDSENILATSQASSNIVSDAVLTWAKQYGARFNIVFVTAPSVYGPAVHPLENSSELTETNRRVWNICSNEPLGEAANPPYGISHYSDVRVRLLVGCRSQTKLIF